MLSRHTYHRAVGEANFNGRYVADPRDPYDPNKPAVTRTLYRSHNPFIRAAAQAIASKFGVDAAMKATYAQFGEPQWFNGGGQAASAKVRVDLPGQSQPRGWVEVTMQAKPQSEPPAGSP